MSWVVPGLVELLMSAALICLAPAIAARFYPRTGEDQVLQLTVGPGDVFRTACFVLGAYLLVRASMPAGRLAVAGFRGVNWYGDYIGDALELVVNLTAGTLLVFGSRKISELLSNLRYDPDTIPAQRFSTAVLLILVLAVAIILGILRMLTVGHG